MSTESVARSVPLAFRFQEDKATEAAAHLLQRHGGRMTRLHLMKLMYFAERKAAELHNRPICGGRYVSMDRGPVLSEVYDLIKGARPGQVWQARIVSHGWNVELVKDSPPSALSEAELEVLDSICDEWAGQNLDDVLRHAHENLAEWENPHGSMLPINPTEFLRAVNKTDEEISEIEEEVQEENYFHQLFT